MGKKRKTTQVVSTASMVNPIVTPPVVADPVPAITPQSVSPPTPIPSAPSSPGGSPSSFRPTENIYTSALGIIQRFRGMETAGNRTKAKRLPNA